MDGRWAGFSRCAKAAGSPEPGESESDCHAHTTDRQTDRQISKQRERDRGETESRECEIFEQWVITFCNKSQNVLPTE